MKHKIIVAADDEWGIGKEGKLPWYNKEDMLFFQAYTIGQGKNAVVFGPKTYENLPHRPLKDRDNLIMRREGFMAIDMYDTVWYCGGAWAYKEALLKIGIDEVVVNRIPGTHNADTFFPWTTLNYKCFNLKQIIQHESFVEEHWFPV